MNEIIKIILSVFLGILFFYVFQLTILTLIRKQKKIKIKIINGLWDGIYSKSYKKDIPLSINYRINAGFIPNSHWVQDKELGGGRIIGEVCHFIDLVMYITNSAPATLYATAIPDVSNNMDTLSVTIRFKNGSIANVQFLSNGSKRMNKEYLEVSSNGISHVLDDFKILSIYTNSKNKKRLFKKNKGHRKSRAGSSSINR